MDVPAMQLVELMQRVTAHVPPIACSHGTNLHLQCPLVARAGASA